MRLVLVLLFMYTVTSFATLVDYLEQRCIESKCSDCCSCSESACDEWAATPRPDDKVQAFYYPWYGTREQDGQWKHWNANVRVGGGQYSPDHDDLPMAFYPALGKYSSSDVLVIDQHMKWMKDAGIGVLVYSWWGKDSFEDRLVKKIMDAALGYGIKVAFYIEPYGEGYIHHSAQTGMLQGSQSPQTARDDIKYIVDTYGCHCAFYKLDGRPVFLFFAARQYMDGDQTEWKQVWDELHADSFYNSVVIAHDVKLQNRIIAGGWDGGHDYSCMASLLTSGKWSQLASEFAAAGKIFYFTVCPGYDKTRIAPGLEEPMSRENGTLYEAFWDLAKASVPVDHDLNPVVITSFNEFHEGTSIEPAIPMSFEAYVHDNIEIPSYKYDDYEGAFGETGASASLSYIVKTREFRDAYLSVESTMGVNQCFRRYVRNECTCDADVQECSHRVGLQVCNITDSDSLQRLEHRLAFRCRTRLVDCLELVLKECSCSDSTCYHETAMSQCRLPFAERGRYQYLHRLEALLLDSCGTSTDLSELQDPSASDDLSSSSNDPQVTSLVQQGSLSSASSKMLTAWIGLMMAAIMLLILTTW